MTPQKTMAIPISMEAEMASLKKAMPQIRLQMSEADLLTKAVVRGTFLRTCCQMRA